MTSSARRLQPGLREAGVAPVGAVPKAMAALSQRHVRAVRLQLPSRQWTRLTVAAVRDAIAAANDRASRAEVMEATGISSSDWNAAMNAPLAKGTLIKTGAAC